METLAVAALTAALTLPGARAELVALRPSVPAGCTVDRLDAPRPFAASGDVALRARGVLAAGAPCDGWAWARVRVVARTAVASRALAEGDAVAGALSWADREVVAGRPPLSALPEGTTAARSIPAGASLDDASVRVGPRPGEPVTVLVRVGALTVEQPGRAIACGPRRACALLPSGRRVEGAIAAGKLVVEAP